MAKAKFEIDDLITEDKNKISKSDFVKKVGQPKKEIVRDKSIASYLSQEEYDKLKAIADEEMTTVSKLVLRAIKSYYKI